MPGPVRGAGPLFAVLVVSLIATILKFGERTQIGAVLLATGLVAGLQLIAAALVWGMAAHVTGTGLQPSVMVVIVSLALAAGDRLLFCGRPGVEPRLRRALLSPTVLHYVRTGTWLPEGWLWRRLARRRPVSARP